MQEFASFCETGDTLKLRVFFTLAGDSIVVYAVEKRKDAYK